MVHLCMWIGRVCQHGNHIEMGCDVVRFSLFYCEIRDKKLFVNGLARFRWIRSDMYTNTVEYLFSTTD